MTQECESVSPDQPCPGSGGTRPAQSGSALPRRYWYALTACVTLAIAIGAYLLQGEYREQADYWQEKLTRIGEVNEHLLKNWISERRDDGVMLAGFPCAQVGASRPPRRQSGPPPMWERQLRMELNSIGGSAAYSGAYILNHNGAVHATSDHAAPFPAELAKAIVGQAENKIITIPAPGGGAGYPQLAFVSPIPGLKRSEPSEQPKLASGYAVLLTRPESIAKLLVTDAAATATGETLFVMLRLNHPVYVSPLRHWRKGEALPPPPAGSPALNVLQERHGGFGEFRDYRRVPVLADTRFIPEPSWGMVTKVDREEAFALFHQTLILGVSTILLLILASVSLAAAWFRQQRIQRLQADLATSKQTEEGLRQSEERFGVALQNSPVVVFNQDRELRYTWVHNPQPPWSEQDYLGKSDEELIGLGEGSGLTELKRPVLDSGKGARKEWAFAYGGETRYYDINIQPLRDAERNVIGITCASTDITERKRMEEQLRQSERRYRLLFETTEAFARTDMGGKFLEVNPAYQRMLGYSAQELGKMSYRDVTPERWHALEEDIVKNQILARGHSELFEKEYRRKDGSVFPVELRGFLIRDDCDQPTEMWAVVRDITRRKQAEERLRQAERLEALGRLAAGVAHDFNNALLGIMLNLEHVIAQLPPGERLLNEELEQALQAARSAASVSRQLLLFGRKRPLHLQDLSLNDVVIRIQHLVKRLAGDNIQVNVRLGTDLGEVKAEPVEMEQVLLNLVVNARDAMPSGGQITIRTANVELEAAPAAEHFTASPEPGSYVVLEVGDMGPGIAKETLSHIFEPFFTTKEEGTGLGLSTSYGIVTNSGGYMSVETELGRGTTIRSYLPRVKRQAGALARSEGPDGLRGRPLLPREKAS